MRNKTLNINLSSSGLNSRFWHIMKRSFLVPIAIGTGRVSGMESQKRGLCPRIVGRSVLPRMESNGMEWEWAED
ncbi:MAG TPA: hypothetical protein DEQ87_17415 [Algoriphagus sp.]|nr:hypothetical protein [Algoriphagus sp.]MAN87725.1 hypothetical protein [Algoriphagus sp.]HCD89396.1 hypothetical protein [Algoriphagus sp.]HCX76325.1 hypothetical protein [Algoriphagus sp.]